MIDLHFHILPGIDDGPATVEESIALARAAAAGGTRVIVATPHVSWRYPNDAETIAQLTGELNERLRFEEVAIEVRTGAEIATTRAGEIEQEELLRLRLGGGPWLLLEPPFTPVVTGLDRVVMDLLSRGHNIVLAHPERCPALHRRPELLHEFVDAGVATSITAGSLTGRFGGEVRRFARRLVDEGLVHNVASDAHDLVRRPPSIAGELQEAGLGALADWLSLAVPEAILSGRPLPPRPLGTTAPSQSRRGLRWLRRVRS